MGIRVLNAQFMKLHFNFPHSQDGLKPFPKHLNQFNNSRLINPRSARNDLKTMFT